jgi:hypothetical protein
MPRRVTLLVRRKVPEPIRRPLRGARTAARVALSPLFVELNHNYANTVLLVGSGRSGTTWFADLVNCRNEYRFIMEPFRSESVRIAAPFEYGQYVEPEHPQPGLLEPASRILSGRVRSVWTDRWNARRIVHRRLIKDVRITNLVPWVRRQFPALKVIYVLRHPYAVAASRLTLKWPDRSGYFLERRDVLDAIPVDRELLRSVIATGTAFERHVMDWCLENWIPVTTLTRDDALFVFYEHLVEHTGTEMDRVSAFLGLASLSAAAERARHLPSPTRNETDARIHQPSSSASSRPAASDARNADWIMSAFGFDHLYGTDRRPVVSGDDLPDRARVIAGR